MTNQLLAELEMANKEIEQLKEDNLLIKSANKLLSDNLHNYKSRCEKANKLLRTIYKALPGTYNQLLIEIDNYLQGSDENE